MPATFSTQHRGALVEVVADSPWERDRIRLLVDGEAVDETKANGPKTVLKAEGFEIRLSFIPDISIELPDVELPDIPWPHLDPPLPQIAIPEWLRDVLRSEQYWLPILIGLVIARAELRRRRNKVRADDRA
jgi:hypothetical protein